MPFPPALFEEWGKPHKANKPDLAHAIRVQCKIGADYEQQATDGVRYVLDGGPPLEEH